MDDLVRTSMIRKSRGHGIPKHVDLCRQNCSIFHLFFHPLINKKLSGTIDGPYLKATMNRESRLAISNTLFLLKLVRRIL